jgi:hypothetical protein
MSVRGDLARLIDELPEAQLERAKDILEELAREYPAHSLTRLDEETGVWRVAHPGQRPRPSLRWPALGPAAVGSSILLGWVSGSAAGPIVAVVGAAVGLILGDLVDQTREAGDPVES